MEIDKSHISYEEESNPLSLMSKTAIAKAILGDPRFTHVGKKDIYKIFGDVCMYNIYQRRARK